MTIAEKIKKNPDGSLNVPDHPIIPFIEGDGGNAIGTGVRHRPRYLAGNANGHRCGG